MAKENEFGRVRLLKNWNVWDNSVHIKQEQIERQGRAMHYPFTFEIDEDENTATFSSTSDLPYYNTTLSNCNCYDFQKRNLPCKHIYRLAVELCVIEIFNRATFDKEALTAIKNSDDIDNEPEQLKRQKSALEKKCTPVSVDKDTCTAVFKSSGKGFYETTLEKCTCRDYFVRRLPCKHIYRLRMELEGVITDENRKDFNLSFEKEEAKEKLKQLSESEATAYIYSLSFDRWISMKDKDKFGRLPDSDLVVCTDDLNITLSFLKKPDLQSICDNYSLVYKKSIGKADLISLILSSLPDESQCELKNRLPLCIKRNDKTKEVFEAVKRLYHRLYPSTPTTIDF